MSHSILFFEFIDILNHVKSINPNVNFLLENVRMKKEYEEVITESLGVEPVMINGSLVSAQDRKRLYWATWVIEQPEDKGILFQSVKTNFSKEDICSSGWVKWWKENREKQLNKKYSLICNREYKAITMIARQYASWNGNFYQIDSDTFRRLTPIECERLQTLPDNYTDGVSDSQRYKMLGNGWTVDVIAHIFAALKQSLEIKKVA